VGMAEVVIMEMEEAVEMEIEMEELVLIRFLKLLL
jgi:hypothetical protein